MNDFFDDIDRLLHVISVGNVKSSLGEKKRFSAPELFAVLRNRPGKNSFIGREIPMLMIAVEIKVFLAFRDQPLMETGLRAR